MAFNFNQSNYQDPSGITWNFNTPWSQQQKAQTNASGYNMNEGDWMAPQEYNLGDDFYRNIGYTGQNTWDYNQAADVSGGQAWNMNPELRNWLDTNKYTFGSGMAGSTPWRGYFDQEGVPVGGLQKGASDSGAFGEFIRNALGLYLGGTALGGALQGAGAAGGGAATGTTPSVFNAAMDSQLANLGGEAVWGAAPAGITGATIATNAPSAVNLGSLGETLATGAGLSGAAGLENAGNITGPPANLAGPGTTGGNLGNVLGSQGLGQVAGGLGSLFTGNNGLNLGNILGLINANNQRNEWDKMMSSLESMYAPDSPYAKQLEETLARKDSAMGRNSQYGPRAVDLAAKLTEAKANTFKDMAALKTNAFGAQNAGVGSLGNILGGQGNMDAIGQIFKGLGTGWDELLELLGD